MSVKVMSWVFEHSPVKHRGDLLVLLVLADHAHDDGTSAYPAVDTIARKARLSRRGTQYALGRLVEQGAIAVTGRSRRGTVEYCVIMEGAQSLHPATTTARGAVSDTKGRSQRHEGVQAPAPEPSVEPSVDPSFPPNPPKGGRVRDRERHIEDLKRWVETAAPGYHPAVAGAVALFIQQHHQTELTSDLLRGVLEQAFGDDPRDLTEKTIRKCTRNPVGWIEQWRWDLKAVVDGILDEDLAA